MQPGDYVRVVTHPLVPSVTARAWMREIGVIETIGRQRSDVFFGSGRRVSITLWNDELELVIDPVEIAAAKLVQGI